MKAYNYLFVSTKDFQEFLNEVELKPEQKVLVRIHSAIHKESEMQQFAGRVHEQGAKIAINDWCIRQKKDVIGEYVENENIQRKLEGVGVVYSRGCYYSKPAPWKEIL